MLASRSTETNSNVGSFVEQGGVTAFHAAQMRNESEMLCSAVKHAELSSSRQNVIVFLVIVFLISKLNLPQLLEFHRLQIREYQNNAPNYVERAGVLLFKLLQYS